MKKHYVYPIRVTIDGKCHYDLFHSRKDATWARRQYAKLYTEATISLFRYPATFFRSESGHFGWDYQTLISLSECVA